MLDYETRQALRQQVSEAIKAQLPTQVERCGDAARSTKVAAGGCPCSDCYEKRRQLREANRQANYERDRQRNRAVKQRSRARLRALALGLDPAQSS